VSFFYQGGAIFLTLCRRYTEAILENGALIVENMKVLKPFVLSGHDSVPGHAGVIINGDQWEFRGSADSKYPNGKAVLETVYASGYFKRENPDYDPENLPFLDVKTLLDSSLVGMIGDEFYGNLLASSYGYVDRFRDYTKELHAVLYPTVLGRKGLHRASRDPRGYSLRLWCRLLYPPRYSRLRHPDRSLHVHEHDQQDLQLQRHQKGWKECSEAKE
jgi:hypothetical protein